MWVKWKSPGLIIVTLTTSSHTHRTVFYYFYYPWRFVRRNLILEFFNTTFSDVLRIRCPYVIALSSNKSESHHKIQMKQPFLLPGFNTGIWKHVNESVLLKYINNLLICLNQKYIFFPIALTSFPCGSDIQILFTDAYNHKTLQ